LHSKTSPKNYFKLPRTRLKQFNEAINITACIAGYPKAINLDIVEMDEFGFGQMLVEHPNHKELTTEELQSLQKLHAVIDRAIADGRISKYEMEQIDRSIYADGKVLVEEITMVRQLVKDKINDGSLVYDWNN
jgi:hypothetical protein